MRLIDIIIIAAMAIGVATLAIVLTGCPAKTSSEPGESITDEAEGVSAPLKEPEVLFKEVTITGPGKYLKDDDVHVLTLVLDGRKYTFLVVKDASKSSAVLLKEENVD